MDLRTALVFLITVYCVLGLSNDSDEQCKKRRGFTGHIFGGERAKKGDWRWVVAFWHWKSQKYFCGGSLISSKHILSGKNL
jgi:secreted trypsin-like serine protease